MPIVFLPLKIAIGPYSFAVFIIPVLVATVGTYFLMPETKNRDISDIMLDLSTGKQRRVTIEASVCKQRSSTIMSDAPSVIWF